jgi:hypothetical protein
MYDVKFESFHGEGNCFFCGARADCRTIKAMVTDEEGETRRFGAVPAVCGDCREALLNYLS